MSKKTKQIVGRCSIKHAIDEGMEDYKKGRVTRSFSSMKEFKTALKKSKILAEIQQDAVTAGLDKMTEQEIEAGISSYRKANK